MMVESLGNWLAGQSVAGMVDMMDSLLVAQKELLMVALTECEMVVELVAK